MKNGKNYKPSSVFVLASLVQAHYWFIKDFPEINSCEQARLYQTEIGGKGLNVSIALHKLGLKTIPVIGCGVDQTAQQCLALLKKYDITTKYILQFTSIASGQGAALINDESRNMISIALGANLAVTPEHVQSSLNEIEHCKLIYAQFEIALPPIEHVFELAHHTGKTTVLNPSPWQNPSESIKKYTHWLIVNEIEVLALLDIPPLPLHESLDIDEVARQLQTALIRHHQQWNNLQLLLITVGQSGAFMLEILPRHTHQYGMNIFFVAGIPVHSVDPTGCGDAFAAAFCSAVNRDFSFKDALEYANCAGAIMAQTQGVLEHLPSHLQIGQLFHSGNKSTAQLICSIDL